MSLQDKIRGSLIGGAAGDALGFAVEFSNEATIFERFGEKGIQDYQLTANQALISDDTQMTLFTANALVLAKEDVDDVLSLIRDAYLAWYQTQNSPYLIESSPFWIMKEANLYNRRAPGMTCLSALASGGLGTIAKPLNMSKGCGGIMRVAPIGLYYSVLEVGADFIQTLAADSSALTHGHILGYLPAAIFAHIISELTYTEKTLLEAIQMAIQVCNKLFPDSIEKLYLINLVEEAITLSQSDKAVIEAIHQLGEGWVAEETLAIALYACLKNPTNFAEAIRLAVNHNGDSDSTGSLAGNIMGVIVGYNAIPERFKKKLELRETILCLGDQLAEKKS